MYNIKLLNKISPVGVGQFDDQYLVGEDVEKEDGVLVRSASMHEYELNDNLKAIAPSQKKVMLELKSRDKEIIKDLREILKNMEIYISYKSIHEEKQHEIKQNLKYFGR